MEVANNSAGRLYDVATVVFANAWAPDDSAQRLLQEAVGPVSGSELLEFAAAMRSAARRIRTDLAVSGHSDLDWTEVWTTQLHNFGQVIATHGLNKTNVDMLRRSEAWLTQQSLQQIRMCSGVLSKSSQHAQLTEDQQEEIRAQVAELRLTVETAEDVAPQLRAALLSYIEQLERAINHVKLFGVDGLGDAVSYGLGTIVAPPAGREPESPSERSLRRKLATLSGSLLATMGMTRRVSNDATETAEAVEKGVKAIESVIRVIGS